MFPMTSIFYPKMFCTYCGLLFVFTTGFIYPLSMFYNYQERLPRLFTLIVNVAITFYLFNWLFFKYFFHLPETVEAQQVFVQIMNKYQEECLDEKVMAAPSTEPEIQQKERFKLNDLEGASHKEESYATPYNKFVGNFSGLSEYNPEYHYPEGVHPPQIIPRENEEMPETNYPFEGANYCYY